MSISLLSNSEFISKIIQDSDTGRSFVPLVGSGLSSPSGIIMGMEFTNYLAFTTYLVLSNPNNRKRTHGEGTPARWDLRHQGWPQLPNAEEVKQAESWLRDQFKTICKQYGLELNYEEATYKVKSLTPPLARSHSHEMLASLVHPQIPRILADASYKRADEQVRRMATALVRSTAPGKLPMTAAVDWVLGDTSLSYHQRVIEAGVRSLHDWRETLVFLSSVDVSGDNLIYESSRRSVIDRFNTFITRDKQPNLGHKMLAHLAGPLRIHALLTTNFDTLIEDAFRALHLRVRVLPVSAKGDLPEPQVVGADCSIVKLHGEMQDTRADLTLDEEPVQADKDAFCAYLTCGAGNLRRRTPDVPESKRLLVLGYSGSDFRCVQMIKYWLENGKERPTSNPKSAAGQIVYWVCFSESDEESIRRIFSAPEYAERVRVTRSSRPDLLLYELYQRLVLSLPPGGLTYEFAHVVPPSRLRIYDHSDSQVRNVVSCAKTMDHPLEAARVMLSESESLDDAMRLTRDASVMELKQMVIDAINDSIKFFDPNDRYQAHRSTLSEARLWTTRYRAADDGKANDRQAYDTMLKHLNFRPVMIDSFGGVVRAVSLAVDELTAKQPLKVLWLETQDYMDADALLRDLMRSLAVRCGSYQSRHVTQHPLSRLLSDEPATAPWGAHAQTIGDYLRRILEDYRLDAKQLLVVLYGRDSYGGCAGLVPVPWGSRDDSTTNKPTGRESHFRPLHCVIEALGIAGIRTLYFPLTEKRAVRKSKAILTKDNDRKVANSQEAADNFYWTPKPQVEFPDWKKWQEWRRDAEHWQDWPADPFCYLDIPSDERGKAALFPHSPALVQSCSVFPTIVRDALRSFASIEVDGQTFGTSCISKGDKNLVDRKLTFLYALTLFRHSRHINALCSEAVYQCPHRFNKQAIDNDFVRSEDISRWIDELRRTRIFFDKPGGSVWMHRDVRLTLQNILEHLVITGSDPSKAGEQAQAKTGSQPSNRYLLEKRARLHFWIADWYFKAFCSSGHLTPVIESLHHRVMAAVFSPFAKFKSSADPSHQKSSDESNLNNYRQMLCESTLLEAQKSLYLAWKALRLWQPCHLEVSWVGSQHRKIVRREIAKAIVKITRNEKKARGPQLVRKRLKSALDGLMNILESICKELMLEGGGAGLNAELSEKSTDPKTVPTSACYSTNDSQVATAPLPSPQNTGLEAYERGKVDKTPVAGDLPPLLMHHGWQTVNYHDDAFNKHIANAFDSPRVGGVQVSDDRNLLKHITSFGTEGSAAELVAKLSEIKAGWKKEHAKHPRVLHDMIWLLAEYAYLMLRRAKLKYHAEGKISSDLWVRATVACNLGVDFCKHLPSWLTRYDTQSKVKLHTIYGVCLANLGRFFEATRHFNEAQALASKMPDMSPADIAVISLRRAEALLTECTWMRVFIDCQQQSVAGADGVIRVQSSPLQMEIHPGLPRITGANVEALFGSGKYMVLIDGQPDSVYWSATTAASVIENAAEIAVPPRICECIRKAASLEECGERAPIRSQNAYNPDVKTWLDPALPSLRRLYKGLLDEAVALLDQSEVCLSGHSQSCLWWSRMYTLRLRVYGLLQPLGDAAADSLILRKRSADQGIFESLRSALRIARDDPFRLLRAIKYFCEANRWHLRFDGEPDKNQITRLPDSLRDAREAFQRLKSLEKTIRQNPSSSSLLSSAIARLSAQFSDELNGHDQGSSGPK